MSKRRHRTIVIDAQTKQGFMLIPEHWFDVMLAWFSAVYSLWVIVYSGWLLFDTWSGKYSTWIMRPYLNAIGNSHSFKIVVYTALGGAMGAAIDNIRSFVQWHADRQGFCWRYFLKHISLPFVGATLGVLVYGVIRGVSGATENTGPTAPFFAWTTGILAGYGSHQVFKWLDDKVNDMLKTKANTVIIPDVCDKSLDEAKKLLKDKKLSIAEIEQEEETTDQQKTVKVILQSPAAGSEIVPDSEVVLTVGRAAKVTTAPLSRTTAGNGQPKASPETSNGNNTDRTIRHTPAAGHKKAAKSKVDVGHNKRP